MGSSSRSMFWTWANWVSGFLLVCLGLWFIVYMIMCLPYFTSRWERQQSKARGDSAAPR